MNADLFKKAWASGLVCLHPTDTLPGLSFDPRSDAAWQRFLAIKQRPPEKSPIALIADWDGQRAVWEDLPRGWDACLRALWPASLSVVWKANAHCPKHLLAPDGTCSLRMPDWAPEAAWMKDFLKDLKAPFPSSSVNRSGDPAISDWQDAKAFLQPFVTDNAAYIPEAPAVPMVGASSSLIKIHDDGSWTLIRAGAVSREHIENEVKKHVLSL